MAVHTGIIGFQAGEQVREAFPDEDRLCISSSFPAHEKPSWVHYLP